MIDYQWIDLNRRPDFFNRKKTTFFFVIRPHNSIRSLVSSSIKYVIFKKVSTLIELPDGRKAYEKSINNDPEKYFTDEVMWEIEQVVADEFKYGSASAPEEEIVITPEPEESTE